MRGFVYVIGYAIVCWFAAAMLSLVVPTTAAQVALQLAGASFGAWYGWRMAHKPQEASA